MQSKVQVLYGTRSTPKDLPNLLEGTGPKIYFDSTEDSPIKMFQYSLKDSAGDGLGFVGNRIAIGFISPRVNITQFHALPDFRSVPQQTPDDPWNPGSNSNISYRPHFFVNLYPITDLPDCFELSIFWNPNNPFLSVARNGARDPCIGFSLSIRNDSSEIVAAVCLDNQMNILPCMESGAKANHKKAVRLLSAQIFLGQSGIDQNIGFQEVFNFGFRIYQDENLPISPRL